MDTAAGRSKVLVVGSANMDLVFRSPRLPRPGETVIGNSFTTFPGGKGANQAVAAGMLGADVSFVGAVGADAFGDELVGSLTAAGVDASRVQRKADTPTGTAVILVEDSGQNSIVVAVGANSKLDPNFVTEALEAVQPGIVLSQLETNLEALAAISAHLPVGARFILNPAPASSVPHEILRSVDLITPNETETEFITGIVPTDDGSCLEAAAVLLDKGVGAVVITLGSKGSFYADARGGRHHPTIEVKAVDTTAAGDAFNGALATFLAEGRDVENAILLANRVGALSATKAGAQASMPRREELRRLPGIEGHL